MLIGWGDKEGPMERGVFPMKVGSMEQYNLLYAVSFLQSPDDADGFSLVGGGSNGAYDGGLNGKGKDKSELQRAVTINIYGKPFIQPKFTNTDDSSSSESSDDDEEEEEEEPAAYPTQTFSSRWNCILDLTPQPHRPVEPYRNGTEDRPGPPQIYVRDALPEPASPFPMSQSPRTATGNTFALAQEKSLQMQMQIAGSKRFSGVSALAQRVLKSAGGPRSGLLTPVIVGRDKDTRDRDREGLASARASYTPPSVSAGYLASPTTFGPPSASEGMGGGYDSPGVYDTQFSAGVPPQTPAYPAYSARPSMSPLPHSHVPISSQQTGTAGPSVEIRRERALASGVQQTPAPLIVGAERGIGSIMKQSLRDVVDDDEGEPIVVSVGLLPPPTSTLAGSRAISDSSKIYPLHTFTLDIFIFNKSNWTRRFEISYPDARKRRKQNQNQLEVGAKGAKRRSLVRGLPGDGEKPGILPLENRVRIGYVTICLFYFLRIC